MRKNMDNKGLYNYTIIDTYKKLIQFKYPNINFEELLKESGIDEPTENKKNDTWLTQKQVDKFYEKLVKKSANSNIAYEAGKFSTSPEGLGEYITLILDMENPINVYNALPSIAGDLTKTSEFSTKKISENEVIITVSVKPEYKEKGFREQKYQCENRKGYLEAIPAIFDYDATITEEKCGCKDDEECIYKISWGKSDTKLLHTVTKSYTEYINKNSLYISLLKDMAETLGGIDNIDDLLKSTLTLLKEKLDYERFLIMLKSDDNTILEFGYSLGAPEHKELLKQTKFHVTEQSQGTFVVTHRDMTPQIVLDVDKEKYKFSEQSRKFAELSGVKSFICCPILYKNESLGVLEVDNPTNKRQLDASDVDLLMGVAYQLGAWIKKINDADEKLKLIKENHEYEMEQERLKKENVTLRMKQEKLERENLEKKNLEKENLMLNMNAIYHSAHTFQKCYNIPLRNMCYRLRQHISPDNFHARHLTHSIEDFIDLWANQFAIDNYKNPDDHPSDNLKTKTEKGWLEKFLWNKFNDDIMDFAQHLFLVCINDLYDHYNQDEIRDILPFNRIWEYQLKWDDFFKLEFKLNNVELLGIQPLFRVILVNMLQNAIEALDLFDVVKHGLFKSKLPEIKFSAEQDEDTTIITISNKGFAMDNKIKERLKTIFEDGRNGKLLEQAPALRKKIKKKEYTSKSGTGTGWALIEAASYLSRIQKNDERGYMELNSDNHITEFKIHMPYGRKKLQKEDNEYFSYNGDCVEYKQDGHDIKYKWNIPEEFSATNNIEETNEEQKNPILLNDDACGIWDRHDTACNEYNFDKQIPDQNSKILVIEDSRPDRLRFRTILYEEGYEYSSYFAWDASKKEVLPVNIIVDFIEEKEISHVVLDLAWNTQDEKTFQDLLWLGIDEIKTTMEEEGFVKPKSFEFIEDFLKECNDKCKTVNDLIILSMFITPTACGLKEYIAKQFFEFNSRDDLYLSFVNKWREEKNLRSLIRH
jgi:putative methionine-R-sulfoxide reductase with GAF domain